MLHKDAKGFYLQFEVIGFVGDLTTKTLMCRLRKPDGTVVEKSASSITILDPETNTIGVAIVTGDLDQTGVFTYQVFDITGGIFLPTDEEKFLVGETIAATV